MYDSHTVNSIFNSKTTSFIAVHNELCLALLIGIVNLYKDSTFTFNCGVLSDGVMLSDMDKAVPAFSDEHSVW